MQALAVLQWTHAKGDNVLKTISLRCLMHGIYHGVKCAQAWAVNTGAGVYRNPVGNAACAGRVSSYQRSSNYLSNQHHDIFGFAVSDVTNDICDDVFSTLITLFALRIYFKLKHVTYI